MGKVHAHALELLLCLNLLGQINHARERNRQALARSWPRDRVQRVNYAAISRHELGCFLEKLLTAPSALKRTPRGLHAVCPEPMSGTQQLVSAPRTEHSYRVVIDLL